MPSKKFFVDTNILIDFLNSDFTILKAVNEFVGQVCVPDRLLVREVPQLSFKDCEQVGMEIITPTDKISKIAGKEIGQLSYIDRLVLYMSKDLKTDVVSNDSGLASVCEYHGVKVIRGFRLLIELAEASDYSIDSLIQIAEKIHETNPLYINRRIVNQFINIVSKIRN